MPVGLDCIPYDNSRVSTLKVVLRLRCCPQTGIMASKSKKPEVVKHAKLAKGKQEKRIDFLNLCLQSMLKMLGLANPTKLKSPKPK